MQKGLFFLSTSPWKSVISVMHFWSQLQELELDGKWIHKIEDLKRILIEKVVKNQRPEIGQKIKGYPLFFLPNIFYIFGKLEGAIP